MNEQATRDYYADLLYTVYLNLSEFDLIDPAELPSDLNESQRDFLKSFIEDVVGAADNLREIAAFLKPQLKKVLYADTEAGKASAIIDMTKYRVINPPSELVATVPLPDGRYVDVLANGTTNAYYPLESMVSE